MKALSLILTILIFVAGGVYFFLTLGERRSDKITIEAPQIEKKPLERYSFESLKKTPFASSEITFGQVLKEEKNFTSRLFYFTLENKKVSGLVNIPKKEDKYPVIIMFRGYIDRGKYTTGDGTRRAAESFASSGFITLAPDFLGYGESDMPSSNPMEERFQTYVTALTLLSSVDSLNKALETERREGIKAEAGKVGIWGHSNGGQISLSILEMSGKNYPTVLWAPVSKPFPYSVLYYTDDFDDHGKMLRKVIADFEKDYDAEKYSLTNYLGWVNTPIQLHQGGEDEAVPQRWSDELIEKLKELKKDVTYYVYPGDDHNFSRGSWGAVVARNISFYKSHL